MVSQSIDVEAMRGRRKNSRSRSKGPKNDNVNYKTLAYMGNS